MMIKDERYVVATKEYPVNFVADYRQAFYRIGDLTEDILDAYKWVEEQDAKTHIDEYIDEINDYEVRKVDFFCEVE